MSWQDTITWDQMDEMSKAAVTLGAEAGDRVTAKYRLVDGRRELIPGSVTVIKETS